MMQAVMMIASMMEGLVYGSLPITPLVVVEGEEEEELASKIQRVLAILNDFHNEVCVPLARFSYFFVFSGLVV
jgi:hypothetical protein